MSDVPSLPPADWYPDPLQVAQRRYWDGTQWTAQTYNPIPDSTPTPPPPGSSDDAPATSDGEKQGDRTRTSEGHLILNSRVERMLDIEKRLGLRIDSIMAVFVQTEYDKEVVVLGDLVAEQGLRTGDLEVIATAYNESGQVIGKDDTYLDLDGSGSPIPFRLTVDLSEPPSRLRLMAKPA